MRPLENIRVLDLTHVLAGPFCTYQLAMMGADVIKIEDPNNPDMSRDETSIPGLDDEQYGTAFMTQNAGKRSLTLNLRSKAGKEALQILIKTADVLVQNFAGQALSKLGFGYDEVKKINPEIIYCSMTGYGRTGPKSEHPAYDIVIQAFAGLMAANGPKPYGPLRVGPPMIDYSTGAQAAFAVMAAVLQRHQTGKGQYIDVSMLDTALLMMSAFVTDTIATGASPVPHGNIHPAYAGYRSYDTADGQIMIGAWTNKQLSNLMHALGETDRAEQVLHIKRSKIGNDLARDTEIISDHMTQRSAQEWEDILNAHHVPAARIRELSETINHEQVTTRQGIQINPEPAFPNGPTKLPVTSFSFAHAGPKLDRPPPMLGEHNIEILKELGYDADQIQSLSQDASG